MMDKLGCGNIDSAMSYCYFFGAYSVGYGIKDCVNILHTPSGCQRRILYLWSMHDNSINYKVNMCTNIIDKDVIFGTEGKLAELVEDTIKRYQPKIISIVSSCAPEIIGMDYDIALADIKRSNNIKILDINSPGFKGDFYTGFQQSLSKLVKSLPINKECKKDTVNIIGYFYSRYEEDENSNIAELKRLIESLGLKVNVVFMSGCEYEKLEEYSSAEYNIVLPYGKECLEYLERVGKQKNILCNMPIGIDGTIEFIKKISNETNKQEVGETFIKNELSRVIPKIEPTIHVMNCKKACLISDEQNIIGLLDYILELGIEPAIIGYYNNYSKEIREKIDSTLKKNTKLKYAPIILDNCNREEVKNAIRENYIDICIGSSIESRDLDELNVPVVEMSFPLFEKHYNFPSPMLGFDGALNIDTIIFNKLNKYSMRRTNVKDKLDSIKEDKYFLFKWLEEEI